MLPEKEFTHYGMSKIEFSSIHLERSLVSQIALFKNGRQKADWV